jgi:glutathione synthase/RimK-type ligase-like ATP-grasp enzyme
MVVKQPDSAFSRGVHKVKNEEELQGILDGLFEQSDLIIGQEFLPSEYDWRIGVLDKEPLYACRYYMAKDHWQIVNYQAEKDTELWGRTETLPLDQVPRKVVETAVAAASLIGDGLYGVDLKEYGSRVYVIEINDNPNIDSGIEDLVLKEELYHKIMAAFMKRLKKERSEKRWVSN